MEDILKGVGGAVSLIALVFMISLGAGFLSAIGWWALMLGWSVI